MRSARQDRYLDVAGGWLLVALTGLGCTGAPPVTGVDGGGSGTADDTAPPDEDDDGGDDTGGSLVGDCDAPTVHPDEDVFIDSQTEVDAFCGVASAVTGDLVVDVGTVEDPITELDGIGCLCEVGGDFFLTGDSSAPPPPHVTGDIELEELRRVGGDFVLSHHPNLDYVQSLVSLTEVGGDLRIEHNPNLQVAKFFALERVGGTVVVTGTDRLLILGLSAATSLGGVELGSAGDADTLYFFVELGLEALVEVTGDLRVVGPRNLGLVKAEVLERIDGALHLEAACVTTLRLPALESVGQLHLVGNCALTDLEGLGALTTVTGIDDEDQSVMLSANAIPADTAADFVAGLSLAGEAVIDTETSCDEVLAAYGESFCD